MRAVPETFPQSIRAAQTIRSFFLSGVTRRAPGISESLEYYNGSIGLVCASVCERVHTLRIIQRQTQ